ncbi:hypothetical protein SNOG_06448 [Parastagonospora nodorum SN15]|nr:hypothetical protein SNOG_06448 [Parastagonospora nodorum SN15]EAT86279.2 hypothetical protein SNOG_06448 [Parastagonospora nodorum SN15]
MTIASIASPRWISYSTNGERKFSYGLHTRCSAETGACEPFPKTSECGKHPAFCNMWRTVGFLISFAVVAELCTLVSFAVIVGGGVQRRAAGWQVVSGVLLFSAVVQCAGMAIVAYLYDNDTTYFFGGVWHLDRCFHLVTASWTILFLTSVGIIASALYLPAEGDYELIVDDIEPDDRLLSRIAAWDNGWKGSNSSEEYSYQRDQDGMSDMSSLAGRRESDLSSFKGRRDSSVGGPRIPVHNTPR